MKYLILEQGQYSDYSMSFVGTEYWNTRIDNNYENYKIAYSIYKKLI